MHGTQVQGARVPFKLHESYRNKKLHESAAIGGCSCFETQFSKNRVLMQNSIFRKSSYSQIKLKKKKKICGTQVPWKKLEFMELKFHTKTQFW